MFDIGAFTARIGFWPDDTAFFLDLDKKLSPHRIEINSIKQRYMALDPLSSSVRDDSKAIENELDAISEKAGICNYSVHLYFLILCAGELYGIYIKKGLGEDMFYDIMTDLKYKLDECKKVKGVRGTFVFEWFWRHYTLRIFALGRFQYEMISFPSARYSFGDIQIKKGDPVYHIHIPSSTPITKSSRFDSYKKAYDFFSKGQNKPICFICYSWLLCPGMKNVYPETSNLMGFYNDFDIVDEIAENEAFPDCWRVFGTDLPDDLSLLPAKTTLQKNIISYLASGNKIGEGFGIIIFDGKKILNNI